MGLYVSRGSSIRPTWKRSGSSSGPVCIERFKHQANVEAKWVELRKVDTWRRDDYIKDSGFATPPGSTSPNVAVADACADALSKIILMQTPAAK